MNCEKCGIDVVITTKYQTGRFCSRKCANSRQWADADKLKKSLAARRSDKVKTANEKYGRFNSYKAAATRLGISLDDWYKLREAGKLLSQNIRTYIGCKNCGGKTEFRKVICEKCRMSYYTFYRPSCEFRFKLSDYPNWFNFDLLKEHGMYSASNRGNNLSGVSRDHMYSVKNGFTNNIDPKLISHPANCKLMLYSENSKKKSKSSITLGELKARIKEFDEIY